MSTPAQLAANQANAQLSTGPRTEAGQIRAAQNARTHGLTSAHLVIAEPDLEAFESMRAALVEEVAPRGELELTLFDALLHANWNIRRCRVLEAEMMVDADPLLLEQNEAKLRQLDRHARRHDASFHRALRQLKALQTERAFRNLAVAQTAEPPPRLADTKAARHAFLRENTNKTRTLAAHLDRSLEPRATPSLKT